MNDYPAQGLGSRYRGMSIIEGEASPPKDTLGETEPICPGGDFL
jgi:hypothetical protein